MIIARLKNWRKMIPAMDCIPGCHKCCEGFAPDMMKEEWYRINHPGKYSMGEPFTACPFLGTKGCEIYFQRPLICRLFGTVAREEVEAAELPGGLTIFCREGMQPKEPLPLADALKITTAYIRLQHHQLGQTVDDFIHWHKVADLNADIPEKFQWLQYFLSTATGKKFLQMQRQQLVLDGQQLARVHKMTQIMEAKA
jgi:Fe-S-cluster containining protein